MTRYLPRKDKFFKEMLQNQGWHKRNEIICYSEVLRVNKTYEKYEQQFINR